MTPENLPPSLAVVPNIPPHKQTDEQLRQEAAYWQGRLDSATGWGASVAAAYEFLTDCTSELARREKSRDT